MVSDFSAQYDEMINRNVELLVRGGEGVWVVMGELGAEELECFGEHVVVRVSRRTERGEG